MSKPFVRLRDAGRGGKPPQLPSAAASPSDLCETRTGPAFFASVVPMLIRAARPALGSGIVACPMVAHLRRAANGECHPCARDRYSGSQRRLRWVAVVPWTTMDAMTHTVVVQNTVAASVSLNTPAPTATAT